jgi:hypothetical protein
MCEDLIKMIKSNDTGHIVLASIRINTLISKQEIETITCLKKFLKSYSVYHYNNNKCIAVLEKIMDKVFDSEDSLSLVFD